ncbi:hypothetical protein [Streptomyces sp. NPDC046712]|uniref:hypothetical protein n=1 Tax=Streptomyces sp. NPDC046712 TaxID=3154802 RepID=UPI0033E1C2A0
MSTDAHHPSSRITDALLPSDDPAARPENSARPVAAAAPDRNTPRPNAAPHGGQSSTSVTPPRPEAAPHGGQGTTRPSVAPPRPEAVLPGGQSAVRPSVAPPRPEAVPPGGQSAARPSVAPPRPEAAPPAPQPTPTPAPQPTRAAGAQPMPAPAPQPPHGVPPRPQDAPPIPGAAPAPAAQRPASAPAVQRPAPASDVPVVETTTRLRPIRATEHQRPAPARPAPSRPGPPHPAPPRPHQAYGAYRPYTAPPETPVETTTRLRPIRERRPGRVVAAGACLVLGLGLIGGAVAGAVLAAADAGAPARPAGYEEAKSLWHDVPVDTLFPRTLAGPGAGPGAADRTWTRVVVAADAPCSAAVLQKSLLTAVRTVGCERVLRATYTDATASSVVTVGLVFTQADPEATRSLAAGSAALIATDVPPALAAPGTVAARFGAAQRASWFTRPLTDLPVVVTTVSGFADGRRVDRPEPAERAMASGQTSAPAQAGLGHEAKGVADRIERGLRAAVTAAAKDDDQ